VVQYHLDTVVVLGAEAEQAEIDYGWIEPGQSFESPVASTLRWVNRFWEKPSPRMARSLLAQGCLWNMFVMIGRASVFLTLLAKVVSSATLRALWTARRCADPTLALNSLWPALGSGDFSRDVPATTTKNLAVLRVGDIGWSDLGTPARVKATIVRSGILHEWHESVHHETLDGLAHAVTETK